MPAWRLLGQPDLGTLPLQVRLTYGVTLEQKGLAGLRWRLLLQQRGTQGLRGGWSDPRVATLAR